MESGAIRAGGLTTDAIVATLVDLVVGHPGRT
jgi:hypothetical protein